MVIFQTQNVHILRQSTLSGSCRTTQSIGKEKVLVAGPVRVQFLIMECIGTGGFVYDAYTGWNSVSRITIEEIIPSKLVFVVVLCVHVIFVCFLFFFVANKCILIYFLLFVCFWLPFFFLVVVVTLFGQC